MSRPNNGPFESPPHQYSQTPNQPPSQGRGRGLPVMSNQFSRPNFQNSGPALMQTSNPGQSNFAGQPQLQGGFQPSQPYTQQQLMQTINPGQPGYLQTGRGLPVQTNVFQTNVQPYQPG